MCTTERFATALAPGTHASTFGGNPLACAAATAVFDGLIEGGVLARAQETGIYLAEQLSALAGRLGKSRVIEARGAGHLQALELDDVAAPIVDRCREDGVLLIQAGLKVIRLAPALIITREQIDEGIGVLERALTAR
jgi:acetylornithine/N-succinyldiaminopimelate aminotransferase